MDFQTRNKPYVICHILSSLDGKINGPFMGANAARGLSGEYGRIREEMAADAWLYGTTTTKEFVGFRKPEPENVREVPKGDFAAETQAELYYISVDVKGEIGWESGTFRNRGRKPAHVIEVVTEATPIAYKAYLRSKGVSYIIAGKEQLDCRVAMEKLYELFQIEKVLICGGGVVNWSFLRAGMVDELSLLLAPVTDGSCGSAALFTYVEATAVENPIEFQLKTVEKVGDSGLYFNYLVKNVE